MIIACSAENLATQFSANLVAKLIKKTSQIWLVFLTNNQFTKQICLLQPTYKVGVRVAVGEGIIGISFGLGLGNGVAEPVGSGNGVADPVGSGSGVADPVGEGIGDTVDFGDGEAFGEGLSVGDVVGDVVGDTVGDTVVFDADGSVSAAAKMPDKRNKPATVAKIVRLYIKISSLFEKAK